jgi:aspartate carbamoyltransferase regulatory subunit
MEGGRTCITCEVTKPLSAFLVRSDTKKPKGRCAECERVWHKEHYKKNRTAKIAKVTQHYGDNREQIIEKHKEFRQSRHYKNWVKNYKLEAQYGIGLDLFHETIEAQKCHCPICRSYFPKESRFWHTDHCHDSGEIRGVICHYCNLMLGNAKDSAKTLRAAAEYLEKFRGN